MKNPLVLLSAEFENHTVNALEIDGKPVFVARELGAILGFKDEGKYFVTGITRDDEFVEGQEYAMVSKAQMDELSKGGFKTPFDSRRGTLVLFESGVHMALVKTRKPAGKRLRRWLVTEVLPQIARTGRYEGADVVDLEIRRMEAEAALALAMAEAKATIIHAQAAKLEANARNNRSIASKIRARAKLLPMSPPSTKAPDISTREDDWFYKQEMCFHLGLVTEGKKAPRYAVLNKALAAAGLFATSESGTQDKKATEQLIDVAIQTGRAKVYSKNSQGRKGAERREVVCFAPEVTLEVSAWLVEHKYIEPQQTSLFKH